MEDALRASPPDVYILGLVDVFWVNVWMSWKRFEDYWVLGVCNTQPGPNRKYVNMYNGTKCNEVEEAHGALPLSLLCVRGPQFQNDEIERLMSEACVNWYRYSIVIPAYRMNIYRSMPDPLGWLTDYLCTDIC